MFALTTRGLETVGAAELGVLEGVEVQEVGYRRVGAMAAPPLGRLLRIATVDDIFIELDTWQDLSPRRDMLPRFQQLAAGLRLTPALAALAEVRPLADRPAFSVTVNFVGKRNYSAEEIKTALAAGLTRITGWQYAGEDAAELNFRLFIEHSSGYVGLRLSDHALHSRPYKQDHLSGSLKPPVAAALIYLAQTPAGAVLLDPFCGAGTIAIEAALKNELDAAGGPAGAGLTAQTIIAGDIDPAALAAARANAVRASFALALARWDGLDLPLPAHSIDRIVTNLPWGRQVTVDAALEGFYRQAGAEISRLLVPGGRAVILTNLPALVHIPDWQRVESREISLFGQNPTILIYEKAVGN